MGQRLQKVSPSRHWQGSAASRQRHDRDPVATAAGAVSRAATKIAALTRPTISDQMPRGRCQAADASCTKAAPEPALADAKVEALEPST